MFGGYFNSSSRKALLAVSAFVGGMSVIPVSGALAADLGGDCCADLEERVAELEATTARKGNRKQSLTIYGQVNRALLFWDDGTDSDVYHVDNDSSSSRLGVKGKANGAGLEFGYLVEYEMQSSASNAVSQTTDDAGGAAGTRSLELRHAAVYAKGAYGKVTLGHTSEPMAGITEVDLSGTKVIATARGGRWNDSFLTLQAGAGTGGTWGNLYGTRDGHLGGTRWDLIRYDTPRIAGFVASVAHAEDDFWSVALRYAEVFGDFKVAAGIGYREHRTAGNVAAGAGNGDGEDCSGNVAGGKCDITAGSIAIVHSPTGLNVHFAAGEENVNAVATNAGANTSGDFWYIKAGISQNFFGPGKTSIYGEYYDRDSDAADFDGVAATNLASEVNYWGLGIVQNIDAAATELYVGYRSYSASVATVGDLDDLNMVMGGMRVKF